MIYERLSKRGFRFEQAGERSATRDKRAGNLRHRRWLAVTALLLSVPLAATPAAWSETRQVVAGPEFTRSALHSFWWGKSYRELWAAPIEVEVLDLRKEAGGLEIVRQVGAMQTPGLALKGADGRSYTFRSVKKDLARVLPEEWQKTVVAEIMRDQNAANHPGAFAFMSALPEPFPWAVLPPQRLVVMPDDPLLGKYRELFAGRLGTFGEFPLPAGEGRAGFMGATEIISSKKLWHRWLEGPKNRADTEEFLRLRIADLWTGNWDRHSKQYRWARLPGKDRWMPIAEDPDQVFADYQGLLFRLARSQYPKLVAFEDKISPMEGLAFNGADIDRWILTDLDREAFIRSARTMQAELTDEVIDNAMRAVPEEWYAINGQELAGRLKKRRDNLEEAVERYYRWLAGEVNVYGTDRNELASVRRSQDGSVEVTLSLDEEGAGHYYRRRFEAKETRSVRIYLLGGDDRVITEGPPVGRIKVIVVGGPGDDALDDGRGGGTRFYDFEGRNEVVEGQGTRVDARSWKNPYPSEDKPWVEPRDFGAVNVPAFLATWNEDLGFVPMVMLNRTSWSFRKLPHDKAHQAGLAYSAKRGRFEFDYVGSFYKTNSHLFAESHLRASGLRLLNFFGFGNETVKDEKLEDQDFYRVEEDLYRYLQTVNWNPNARLEIFSGLEVKYSEESSSDTLIAETRPYGSGRFGQLGLVLGFEWDTRRAEKGLGEFARVALEKRHTVEEERRTGVGARVEGSLFPEVWDVEETFGALEGELAGSLALGVSERIVAAAKIGGRKVWGDFPWHEAAFIGGSGSNRGFVRQRFAGEEAAYGSLELRLRVFDGSFQFPENIWLFGLADAGRVWVDGEDSDEWHPSYGAGVVVEMKATPVKLRAEWARNDEEDSNNFYFAMGFSF